MNMYLVFIICYLLGALPFGVIAAKFCGVDIFSVGSGSTGTTNVIRACGKKWGITVLVLDILKGTLATYLGMVTFSNEWLVVLCGILAMVGHSYSIFIKFKGGKAAATGVGLVLAINPSIFLFLAVMIIVIRQLTGYQSIASLIPALLAPFLFYYVNEPLPYLCLAVLGAAFIWLKHIPNIKRLLKGQENKITGRNK